MTLETALQQCPSITRPELENFMRGKGELSEDQLRAIVKVAKSSFAYILLGTQADVSPLEIRLLLRVRELSTEQQEDVLRFAAGLARMPKP